MQLAWKNLPLPMHKHSALAALAAEGANAQGKFWQMHDKLFENQAALDRASLEKYAQELGLDPAKFKTSLDVIKPGNIVDSDAQQAQRFGQQGTPAFFVNGRSLMGALPFESWKTLIDEEIKKADAKLAAGVARAKLYEELIKDGIEKAAPPPSAADESMAAARPDPNTIYRVEVGASPVRGDKDALVTVVVFSEFECPYCARVEPTLAKLMDAYKGKVRLVWKDFPLSFHRRALPAALAARAAGEQDKFWQMHDRLFADQAALDHDSLEKHAQELKLDMPRFRAALDSEKQKAAVQADARQGGKVGVAGTPAFFVNGVFLSGALPFESFKETIDEQLKKAQALVANGTPRARVYDAIMKTGKAGIVEAVQGKTAGRRVANQRP